METNKLSPPVINEVRPIGTWMYHAIKQDGSIVPFEQHIEAAKQAGATILEEYSEHMKELKSHQSLDTTQPFCLEVAILKGSLEAAKQRKLAKKQKEMRLGFTDNAEEKLPEFVKSLEKMLWSIKKTLNNKSADFVAFYFEFSIKEQSADLDTYRMALSSVINEPPKSAASTKNLVTLD